MCELSTKGAKITMNKLSSIKFAFWILLTIVLCSGCGKNNPPAGPTSGAPSEMSPSTSEAGPAAITAAFDRGDAKTWRLATMEEVEKIRQLSDSALEERVDSFIERANEHDGGGLEPVLMAGISELAVRGETQREKARALLKRLGESDWLKKEPAKYPNAYAPVVRGHARVAHYVPLPLMRSILRYQASTLITDPEQAIQQDVCSEEGLAAIEMRWGADRAALMRQACDQVNGGGDGGNPALPGGVTTGTAVLSCLMTTNEPSRAERLTGLMQECLVSIANGSGNNPLADGSSWKSTWDPIWPLRKTHHEESTPNGTTGEPKVVTTYDASSTPITRTEYNDDGSKDVNYYDDNSYLVQHVHIGSDGQMDYAEAIDGTKVVERVDFNDDGGYTVTRYDDQGVATESQRYNEKGEPVNDDGTLPETPPSDAESPGSGKWGDTKECRAMTFALFEDRIQGNLEQGGIIPPGPIVNPNPDAEGNYEIPEDLKCLSAMDLTIDRSMGCARVALCPGLAIPQDDCGCGDPETKVTLSDMCRIRVMCADGQTPTASETGVCVCQSGEEIPDFVDPWGGGGPQPDWLSQ